MWYICILKYLEHCVAQTYLESMVLVLLYRDISSGGDSTARCVFSCLDELASSELRGLFLLLLAMLTTVVLEALW